MPVGAPCESAPTGVISLVPPQSARLVPAQMPAARTRGRLPPVRSGALIDRADHVPVGVNHQITVVDPRILIAVEIRIALEAIGSHGPGQGPTDHDLLAHG